MAVDIEKIKPGDLLIVDFESSFLPVKKTPVLFEIIAEGEHLFAISKSCAEGMVKHPDFLSVMTSDGRIGSITRHCVSLIN